MKTLSPETIEKLEWLKSRLRKYPHRYDQGSFCGTQACLAGYCAPKALGKRGVTIPEVLEICISDVAARWLGITAEHDGLLFDPRWVGSAAKFNRYLCDTDEEAAEKACQRIDLFIQSGGTK